MRLLPYLKYLHHEISWTLCNPTRLADRSLRRFPDDHQWCFIAGVNNSGTKLLRRILGEHPEISCLPKEGQQLTSALPNPRKMGNTRTWTEQETCFRWTESDDPIAAYRCIYDWAPCFNNKKGRILLEKSPPNCLRTRWLQANFHNASFIVLVRNPYAVVEGTLRRKHSSKTSTESAALHWSRANSILLQDMPHLERVHVVTYEAMCDNTMDELAKIASFLKMRTPFDETSAFGQSVKNMENMDSGIKNFNQDSIDRLTADQLASIASIAGPVMEKLGYV